ncbi:MAG: ACT domain-containing protein [Crocinitomicaceae bacterium]|tara:strand:- start:272 stop:688 length:417 start_codon:yes stop_codon:yes gene_type:complete
MTEISKDLKKVIQTSWFTIENGLYVYAKVTNVHTPEKHLIVTRDSDEITVVTKTSNLADLGDYERNPDNWVLLNIKCGNPFYCEGFLAAIASAFASKGIDITLTSTYTNDYVMVQQNKIDKATSLLKNIGFRQKDVRA